MIKNAVLINDNNNNPDAVSDLIRILNDLNFSLIVLNKFSELTNLNLERKYVFFRNPFIRIKEDALIKLHDFDRHCGGFTYVLSDKEPLLISKDFILNSNLSGKCSFSIPSSHFFYMPKIKPMPIITYTHNRVDYFKLTMNSLLFSLDYDPEANIHLVMSAPTKEVMDYCVSLKKKCDKIILYETKDNVAVGATNLIIQWIKPESFILIEEDFILPQSLKYLFPFWLRQMSYRVKNFDLVGMSTDTTNTPYNFYNGPRDKEKNNFEIHGLDWEYSFPPITYNGLAVKLETYLEAVRGAVTPPFHIANDGAIISKSKNVCFLPIRGYHIGWNQEMDGFCDLSTPNRYPNPSDNQNITCLNTGETKNFNLSDLKKW